MGGTFMKKRVISVLLSLLLVMSLGGNLLSTTAWADNQTITYTLKQGDTVAKVCDTLGIDFKKNYNWITTTNKIKDYSKLPVGMVLTLPAPGTYPVLPSPTPSTAPTPVPGTSPVPTAAPGSGDPVGYYLIQHTMKSGETVYSVCNGYGISFQKNSDTISKLNNITSYTKLKVGQVLLLPSTSAPAAGSYYKVLAHKVVSGDTVVGLCKANGMDYGKNEKMIKAVNSRDNLASIKVGETIYIPVLVGSGTPGTPVTPVTPGTTPTPTAETITYTMKSGDTVAKVCKELGVDFYKNYEWITKYNNIRNYAQIPAGKVLVLPKPGTIAVGPPAGSGTTPSGGAAGGGAYSMHTSSNGTYLMQVNGQTVNTANKGQVVTIYPIPDKGYVLNAISVTKTGGTDVVVVTNNSFTMPDFDITISVTFKPAA